MLCERSFFQTSQLLIRKTLDIDLTLHYNFRIKQVQFPPIVGKYHSCQASQTLQTLQFTSRTITTVKPQSFKLKPC